MHLTRGASVFYGFRRGYARRNLSSFGYISDSMGELDSALALSTDYSCTAHSLGHTPGVSVLIFHFRSCAASLFAQIYRTKISSLRCRSQGRIHWVSLLIAV